MKTALRLGLPIALLLLLTIIGPTQPVFARTPIINGVVGVGEWAGSRWYTDPSSDVVNPRLDLSGIFATNDSSRIYFRFDTVGNPTTWTNSTAYIYLDTVAGGYGASPGDGRTPPGTDYVITVNLLGGSTLSVVAASCTSLDFFDQCNGAVTNLAGVGAWQGQVSEIGVNFAAFGLDLSSVSTLGIAVGFENTTDPRSFDTNAFVSNTFPTPSNVALVSLSAGVGSEGVTVFWETTSELDVAGFNILRSHTREFADAVVLNSELLAPRGDAITGDSYSWVDAAPVGSSYYWLQVVNANGTTQEFGPVMPAATTASTNRIFLPSVSR